jgi:glycine cleavage system H protein
MSKNRTDSCPILRKETPIGTIPIESNACVWMRAGVISYRLCDRDFDCEHCLLDTALHQGKSEALKPTRDSGPVSNRLFPNDRQFSSAHSWVLELDETSVRVGVDALATWLAPEITAAILPVNDTYLERGEAAATLSVKGGKITIPAPISGRVLGRNELALACPELIGSAPFAAGWLIELALPQESKRKQMSRLLSGMEMEKLSRAHLHNFHRRIDAALAIRPARVGATLADGGESLSDPRAILGPTRYLKLLQELLT